MKKKRFREWSWAGRCGQVRLSAPPLAQPLPWGEVPVLEGGEDNGVRPSRTLCTHLTNPRRVRRGGGPAFRGRGGGRSHLPGAPGLFLLSRPGPPRLPRVLSARPAARGPAATGRLCSRRAPRPRPGPSAAECEERLPLRSPWRSPRRSPSRLPAPTYLPVGRLGAMAGRGLARPWPRSRADGGHFPAPRSRVCLSVRAARLILAAPGERRLLPSLPPLSPGER